MRSFIVILGMAALVLQCKPTKNDDYTLRLDSMIGQTDSLNQLISSVQVDSTKREIQTTLDELNSFEEAALEYDSIAIYLKEIERYRAIYAGVDSCTLACVDFFDELHLIRYELEQAKNKYIEGKIEKSQVDTVINLEAIQLHEISLRLSDKIDLLMMFRKEADEVEPDVQELFRLINGGIE